MSACSRSKIKAEDSSWRSLRHSEDHLLIKQFIQEGNEPFTSSITDPDLLPHLIAFQGGHRLPGSARAKRCARRHWKVIKWEFPY